MKVLLLNGNPFSNDLGFESYINTLVKSIEEGNNIVEHIVLRKKHVNYCNGCWNCWIKYPGKCATEDDSYTICQHFITAQLVIFASPLIMGFTSAILKRANDKLLQLLHPYIEIVDGECHHMRRYESYPFTGLIYKKEKDTDKEDVDIVTNIYKRNAINLKSRLLFSFNTNNSIKEVVNEINHI